MPRTTSSAIPAAGHRLNPSHARRQLPPLPNHRRSSTQSCPLQGTWPTLQRPVLGGGLLTDSLDAAILKSNSAQYRTEMEAVWMESEPQTSAYLAFNLVNGVVSIIACKGPRPTKGRPPTTPMEEVVRINIPQEEYKLGIRMYKESFSVEIWLTEAAKESSTVWALVMTSRMDDDRMKAVKGVWERMREVFQRLSLRDLAYVKIPRGKADMAADLPDPPYHFRQRTITKHREAIKAHSMTIEVPGRQSWAFTGVLADPELVAMVKSITGANNDNLEETSSNASNDGVARSEEAEPAGIGGRNGGVESEAEQVTPPPTRGRGRRGRPARRGRGAGRGGSRGARAGANVEAGATDTTGLSSRGRKRATPAAARAGGSNKRGRAAVVSSRGDGHAAGTRSSNRSATTTKGRK